MKNKTRTPQPKLLMALGLAATLLLGSITAQAQNYPKKTIFGVVTYPAGGQADVVARTVVPELQARLGQNVVMDNVAGAGGAIGIQKVLSAPPDGHTLLFATPIETIQTPLALAVAKYKAEDLRMVAPIATTYMMLVVRPTLPVNSVADLVSLAKKSEGKELSFGSVGRGSIYHLVAERFAADTGTQLLHVPYKGAAQLFPDIVGGQIDMVFMPLGGPVSGMIQKGQLKALAYTGPTRHPAFPQIPTMDESKLVKNFVFNAWLSLMVHKNTPAPVVAKLNESVQALLRTPKVRADLEASGVLAADPMTLEASARYYAEETSRYQAIAKTIQLQPE